MEGTITFLLLLKAVQTLRRIMVHSETSLDSLIRPDALESYA